MAKKGMRHIVARIEQLREQGYTKHDAGVIAYREAGHGKSRAKGTGGTGKQGNRGVGFSSVMEGAA
jgi:hypothetical protein